MGAINGGSNVEETQPPISNFISNRTEAAKTTRKLQINCNPLGSPCNKGIMIEFPRPVLFERLTKGKESRIEIKGIAVRSSYGARRIINSIAIERAVKESDSVGLRQRAASKQQVCRPMDGLEEQALLIDE